MFRFRMIMQLKHFNVTLPNCPSLVLLINRNRLNVLRYHAVQIKNYRL